MYLEKILGSKAKIRMLAVLLSGNCLIETNLAKRAGLSAPEVSRQIVDLMGEGLVRMNKVGRSKEYCINKEHFLFEPLRKLFTDLNETYFVAAKQMASSLAKKNKIECVILIGSVAGKKATSESDIDLVVLTLSSVNSVRKSIITQANTGLSSKYGFVFKPIVLSKKEYLERLKKDPFTIKAHSEGIVLYGKKPQRFG